MTKINFAEELRKRGFKLTPLPPLTPEQMKEIEKTNQAVKNFLKKIDEAYKVSAKSTLRFATLKEQDCSSDDSFDKVEVVGEIDPQKLSPAQRRVYDAVNEYSKKLQAARQRPVPHFVVAQHGQRRSSVLNTQKQR